MLEIDDRIAFREVISLGHPNIDISAYHEVRLKILV